MDYKYINILEKKMKKKYEIFVIKNKSNIKNI